MKKYREIEVKKEELTDVYCDVCGKLVYTFERDFPNNYDYYSIEHKGGYQSLWPGDETYIECDICDLCLEKLIGKYVRKFRYDPWDGEVYKNKPLDSEVDINQNPALIPEKLKDGDSEEI